MTREWTDTRDSATWRVHTFWIDSGEEPVPQGWVPPYGDIVGPSAPRISFTGGHASTEVWVTDNPTRRAVEELNDQELEELLDRARAGPGRSE